MVLQTQLMPEPTDVILLLFPYFLPIQHSFNRRGSEHTESVSNHRERRNILVKSASSLLAWEGGNEEEGPGFKTSFRPEQIKCCLGCGLLVLPKDAVSAAFTNFRLLMDTAIKECGVEKS